MQKNDLGRGVEGVPFQRRAPITSDPYCRYWSRGKCGMNYGCRVMRVEMAEQVGHFDAGRNDTSDDKLSLGRRTDGGGKQRPFSLCRQIKGSTAIVGYGSP